MSGFIKKLVLFSGLFFGAAHGADIHPKSADPLTPIKITTAALLGVISGETFARVVNAYGHKAGIGAAAFVGASLGGLYWYRTNIVRDLVGPEFVAVSTLSALITFLLRTTPERNSDDDDTFVFIKNN